MKISPARTAAFDVLTKVVEQQAYSSVLLPQYEQGLAIADRALCHELTLGVLRRQIYLDRLIDALTGGKKIDFAVRIALQIALYQLIWLSKIPDHSAVNESVNLVIRARKKSAKGFANAILRKFLREKPNLDFEDEFDRISVTTSHPRWLIEKWIGDFGIETASAIAQANNEIPRTAFRVLQTDSDVQNLIGRSQASKYLADCWLADRHDRTVAVIAERGLIYLQDEGSQIVANAVTVPDKGRFLDVCAAPGGKTGMIARRWPKASRLLVAGDLHRKRAEHLRQNCERQAAGGVSVIQHDAVVGLPFADRVFDSILVDAPCSGTGTIRHNPELRYFLKESDLAELQSKQLSILTNASKLLSLDGELIYSTCSMEREENESVIEAFLADNGHFRVKELNVSPTFRTDAGFAKTWPHRDRMDGFFIASLERVGA